MIRVLRRTPRDSNHPNDLFNLGMLLLGLNHFLFYEKVSEVMAAEDSDVLPPKCSTNNKEMTKDTKQVNESDDSLFRKCYFLLERELIKAVSKEAGPKKF